MKFLILSCSTGGGHNSAGRALETEAKRLGHECIFLDAPSLTGKRFSKYVGLAYTGTVKHAPAVFGGAYRVAEFISSPNRKSIVYWANRLFRIRLLQYITEGHFDALLIPHLYPAETVTSLRRSGYLKDIPLIGIGTDYTSIPFWAETECDYYTYAHEDLAEEMLQKGFREEQLLPYGIPVDVSRLQRVDRLEARRKLNFSEEGDLALIMSGSMGYGDVPGMIEKILKERSGKISIAVICGSNDKMKEKLEKKHTKNASVHVFGYVEDVNLFLSAADLMITKPGGLTSTEAGVFGIPLIFSKMIPGCETKNRDFFTSHGMAIYAENSKMVAEETSHILENEDLKRSLVRQQQKYLNPAAAEMTIRFTEQKVKEWGK